MNNRIIPLITILMIAVVLSGCSKKFEEQMQYRQEGLKFLSDGEYERAVESMDKALSLSMRVTDAEMDICKYKALAQVLSEDYKNAAKTYTTLIEYDDKDWNNYFLRGSCYLSGKDITKATADYDKACQLDDTNYELYESIADNLEEEGYADEAMKYLNKALTIEGDSAEDDISKGEVYIRMERYDDAKASFNAAVDKGARIGSLYLAQVSHLKQDEESVNKYMKESMAWEELSASEYALRGRIRVFLDDAKGATEDYDKGLEIAENKEDIRNLKRGKIGALEYTGKFKEAYSLAKEYMSEFPGDGEIARELMFLSNAANAG